MSQQLSGLGRRRHNCAAPLLRPCCALAAAECTQLAFADTFAWVGCTGRAHRSFAVCPYRPLGSSLSSHRFLVPAQRNKNEMWVGGNTGIIASPLQRSQAAQQVYRTLKREGFGALCARGAQTAINGPHERECPAAATPPALVHLVIGYLQIPVCPL